MADSTITALSAASVLDLTEVLPVDQAGTTKKATIAQLSAIPLNSQTGTTYTLVLGDAGYCVEMNNGSANTLTVPPNSSVAFPIGTNVLVRQMGAGLTTVAQGSGVTIRTPLTLAMKGQYATANLHKRGTNEWCLDGNIT